jgi:hypothetical protein
MSLKSAWKLLQSKRFVARPNYGFWAALVRWEKKIHKTNSVKMVELREEQLSVPSVYLKKESFWDWLANLF